jgi:hypothetical protein
MRDTMIQMEGGGGNAGRWAAAYLLWLAWGAVGLSGGYGSGGLSFITENLLLCAFLNTMMRGEG